MSVAGITSSLLFGAMGAVTLVFTQPVFAPFVGSANALALHLAICVVAYGVSIGRNPRMRLRNGLVGSIASVAVLSLARSIDGIAIGLTIVLALVRTGLDGEARTGRTLFFETILGCGALAFSSVLAAPGGLGNSVALWGFMLVQSLYFLLPLARHRKASLAEGDPFDRARGHLLALLDEI
ncbi:MAG: hypothetical protein GY910_02675 [bacterium]|nr:hypothetical protein [Deltaproteobacteria bacterium]MCP4903858.1 hypothetical protein [bacterium]